jgi:hypothetical protein
MPAPPPWAERRTRGSTGIAEVGKPGAPLAALSHRLFDAFERLGTDFQTVVARRAGSSGRPRRADLYR